jgi:hypothetical protein
VGRLLRRRDLVLRGRLFLFEVLLSGGERFLCLADVGLAEIVFFGGV